jgi:hypothetical protein
MIRLCVLFFPSLLGLTCQHEPVISIICSLTGSVFIVLVSQTQWFKESDEVLPLKFRLLRPNVTFHLFFFASHVVGDTFYILNTAGVASWQQVTAPTVSDLSVLSTAQALVLLAHASVTAGMKLASFRYSMPKYTIPALPQGFLLYLSFLCVVAGFVMGAVPGLEQVRYKLLQLGSIAVLVELTYAIRAGELNALMITFTVLAVNVISQVLSGWKGLVLWTMITVGALLYPLMPRRVFLSGSAFVLFWLLFLHPFGLVYRPLVWYEGFDQRTAANISVDAVLDMTVTERLDNVWSLMVERANEMFQFEKYLRFVPDNHPYFGLDLAQEALYGLVPRIIWRDKPEFEQLAMRRVYDAGIVVEKSEVTVSAKSNFYQDAYLSFGWLAVIPACLLFGFAMMSLNHLGEQLFGGYEIGTCFIYTALFGEIVKAPPNFLFFVGSTWSSFLVMIGLFIVGRATGWIVPVVAEERASLTRIRFNEIVTTHS